MQRDDSHKRWDNQSDSSQVIWNYYNDIAVRKLMHEFFAEKNISLAELYQRLSLLRAECEWVKEYVKKFKVQNVDEDILKV